MAARSARRIVVVSPFLPYTSIPHAGGVYLNLLQRCLTDCGADVTFVVPSVPNAGEAVGQPGAPHDVVLLGVTRRRTVPRRALMRLAYELDGLYRRWNPTTPPLAFAVQLLTTPAAREALRRADVVDVHWPEYARLIALIRWVNPRAVVVATLHDVLSQRWDRAASTHTQPSSLARRARSSARRLEEATLRRADRVVVFSEKDRDLLLSPAMRAAKIEVVMPPLAAMDSSAPVLRPEIPTVVFVSLLARPENEDAALWLVTEIWPSVARRAPGVRLRLVGKGASARLVTACSRRPDIELVGFVKDLSAVYQSASACIVPVRLGAGVKFKTIEGLIAGVPVVTTAVGAEGIGASEHFAAVSDVPEGLAEAVVRVVTNPDEFMVRARHAQQWALERYAEDQFRSQVSQIYGVPGKSLGSPS